MINVTTTGDFDHTEKMLKQVQQNRIKEILEAAGEKGVQALAQATPKKTGMTAASWKYIIETTPTGYSIQWSNENVNNDVNIAVIIQMGHGTRNGGYVRGIDYINPAMKPTFDEIEQDVWKGVTGL